MQKHCKKHAFVHDALHAQLYEIISSLIGHELDLIGDYRRKVH